MPDAVRAGLSEGSGAPAGTMAYADALFLARDRGLGLGLDAERLRAACAVLVAERRRIVQDVREGHAWASRRDDVFTKPRALVEAYLTPDGPRSREVDRAIKAGEAGLLDRLCP